MRISKKVLSVVLAVLMLASVCIVPSTAATALDGTEDASKINVKYEVTQPDSIWDGGLEAVDGNIYAVTVSVKAAYGINVLQIPLYFDADLFAPIMWQDDDPWGNEAAGVDGWYDNNGEAVVYDFGEGEAWSDTSWYRTNGNTASSTGNARFIGLGNANVTKPLFYKAEYIDSTNTEKYDAYNKVADDNFDGYMFCYFLNNQSKTAYMNGIANKVVTDYISMMTIYFIRQEGVSAEDCIGAEFGWAEGGDWLTQTDWDTSGSPSYFASTYVQGVPGVQYVSNAVVEADAEPTIVNPLKGQIRFDKKDGAYAGTFDVRALATITEKDFNATFTDAATAEDMIEEIGFVFAAGSNVGTPDMAGVKALVENGTALSGYEKKTVDYISTGATNVAAGNYVFSCIVTDVPDADKADSLVAVGYIKWTDAEGTHYNYYPAAQEISFNALYTAHYNRAFPQA